MNHACPQSSANQGVYPVEVGLHAIGAIDRTIYHVAFPEGTAIRFEAVAVRKK
ncbi:hypothetical protein HYR99_19175 [Candidatus Poribacteria bacterium]|nr:hypothetical protein [Candidatus Poribacteria bacterium]